MSRRSREDALKLGPRHECGYSIATLVNAIANYWKHAPEWTHPLSRPAKSTADLISSLGVDVDSSYVVVNALARVLHSHEPRVRYVILNRPGIRGGQLV